MIRIYMFFMHIRKSRKIKIHETDSEMILSHWEMVQCRSCTIWKHKISCRLKRLMFNPNANWSLHSSYVNRCHVCIQSSNLLYALWRLLVYQRVILNSRKLSYYKLPNAFLLYEHFSFVFNIFFSKFFCITYVYSIFNNSNNDFCTSIKVILIVI